MLHSRSLRFWCRSTLAVIFVVLSGTPVWSQQVEVGSAVASELSWTFVPLSGSIAQPVVVPSLPTTGAAADAVLAIRNVSSSGFQIRLIKPNGSSPGAATQTAGWLAVGVGTHQIGDVTIAAGLLPGVQSLIDSDPANFASVTLPAGFDSAPAVLGAIQTPTIIPDEFLVVRARQVTLSGFEIGYQRQESLETLAYGPETLGWIAWETGTGTVEDWIATAARTPDDVTSSPSTYVLGGLDPATTLTEGSVFGMLNTFGGVDPAWVGGAPPVGTSVDLFVDEEVSADPETSHGNETVALVAFAPAPPPAVPLLAPGALGLLAISLMATGVGARRALPAAAENAADSV